MHKPLKGGFNEILAAVALGKGHAKRVAPKVGEKVGAIKIPAKSSRQKD
jgi:hypothetical protein